MAETDIQATSTMGLDTTSIEYKVAPQVLDSTEQDEEFYYYNENFTKYNGYYKTIPELKKAIDALATWTVGKGFEISMKNQLLFENMFGQGKDNDDTILWNLFVMKKVNGDAYAQIIADEGRILDLKLLNPSRVRIVYDKQGMIKRYDYFQNDKTWTKIATHNMLHLINDKLGDEVHGTSIIEACKWVIDARNEAMVDKRKILHRTHIRVIEVDMDDTTKLTELKRDWKEGIKKGDIILLPKGTAVMPNVPQLSTAEHLSWIQYLENFFYQAVGVPRVIATSENFTEASSKIGYLSFEPVYTREQKTLEKEILNQLGIAITFNRPPSLQGTVQEEQSKNVGQTAIQPSEAQAAVTRNE